VPLLRRDGSRFGVLCALDPRPTQFQPGVLRIFHLLAELVSFQIAAVEAHEEHEAVVLDLRQTVKVRDELLAIIGHDLRTPLSAITIAAAMMQTSSSAAEIRELSTSITAASARMGRLLNTLLDFTRSRLGGGITLSPREANLRDILERVVDEVGIGNPGREIQLVAEGTLDGSFDADRLAQAFTNLVANAIKYSPDDSVVQVRIDDCGPLVRVEIRNQGDLIDPGSAIFEPFVRGERHDRGYGEGLGLGLYIVRQIIHAHGGTVSARASVEEGNVFRVELPRVAIVS